MDNPLTPKKIQRLMYLAEDLSFPAPDSLVANLHLQSTSKQFHAAVEPSNDTGSLGLLDLDNVDTFGDSATGMLSKWNKSTAFNVAELTGRSTGTEDLAAQTPISMESLPEFGRYSVNSLESLTKKLNQQSSDVKELVRQSIASSCMFTSKKDLTADEAYFITTEAPIPVKPSEANLKESMIAEQDSMEISVGSYFGKRCIEFNQMLPRAESPRYDMSIASNTIDGSSMFLDQTKDTRNDLNTSLDSIPVRQPSNSNKKPEPKKLSPVKNAMGPPSTIPSKSGFAKPTALLAPSKQHLYSFLRTVSEESENYDSLSLSKIANILRDESNISAAIDCVTNAKHTGKAPKVLTEVDMNTQSIFSTNELPVTSLKDSKNTDVGCSASSVNTVIDLSKLSLSSKNMPSAFVAQTPKSVEGDEKENLKRSKSPSSKSCSTQSTIRENMGSSFKLTDSPVLGECKSSAIASPSSQYRELDRSVDWQEVLQARGSLGLAKEWAEIVTKPMSGFVGSSASTQVTVKSLSENWLTARFEFTDYTNYDVSVDLPRFPILLTPGKQEQFNVQITANAEMDTKLAYTLYLKDSAIDEEMEIKGHLPIVFRVPVLQAISSSGVNRVVFPPTTEGKCITKTFILVNEHPIDLQLDLSMSDGSSVFMMNSVQEINKNAVNKKLLEETVQIKPKTKGTIKQLCRLSLDHFLRVTVIFMAPKLNDFNLSKATPIKGSLNVSLIGINVLLKKIDLMATVGTVDIALGINTNKLHVGREPMSIPIKNTGSLESTWLVKVIDSNETQAASTLFKTHCNRIELGNGATECLKLCYVGPDERMHEGTLILEEISTNKRLCVELTGGKDKITVFPIKTTYSAMSWVKAGRKEISLKNSTDKKVHLKCRIVGEQFLIDLPRSAGQTLSLTFGPSECRSIPIAFNPSSGAPCTAVLHLACERENEISRKVLLYGCASAESLYWSQLVAYGDTALVPAIFPQPVELKLANKSKMPAFLVATVHFHLQFTSVAPTAQLVGSRRIVPARGTHSLRLNVDWGKVESRARDGPSTTLATVTVVTGAELTRKRILRILKKESNGQLDVSALPEHLKRLAGSFEGEDPSMDGLLADFNEPKSSINELVSGLRELTAHIELHRDFGDNTIVISDETVMDHHTLCD